MSATPAAAKAPRPFGRRWLRRGGLAGVVLALLGGALLFWLLATVAGRDTLLQRVVAMLPPDSLTWERAEGVIRGPLVLHGVRFRQDGLEFTARRVLLDPDLLPALGRRLQLDRLEVEGAWLSLPPSEDEPFALPEWPGSLPRVPMPLDVRATVLELRGLRIVRGDDTLADITRADASALQFVDDGFRVGSLRAEGDFGTATLRGDYLPAHDYRSDLTATLARPAAGDAAAVGLQLTARGDLADLAVELAGTAPGRLSLALALKGRGDDPTWTLEAHADAIDPALVGAAPGEPWRGKLSAQGRGGGAEVAGDLRIAGIDVGITPSKVTLADGVLRADPLLLELAQGPVRLVGTLRVEGDDRSFDLVVGSTGLHLEPASGEAAALPVDARGEVRASGTFDAWTLAGDATLLRAGAEARLDVDGTGDRRELRLHSLKVQTPNGDLDGRGAVHWDPALAFELDARLDGFDPGYFLPDYPGAVSGALAVTGRQGEEGGWQGQAHLQDLSGQLRGRALSGRAQAEWNGDAGTVDADLGIGDSRLQVAGGFGARLDLQVKAAPLQLADLFAGAAGRLDGTLGLRGPMGEVDLEADLTGSDLAWHADRATTLRLAGRLPARGGGGTLEVDASGLVLSGINLDRLATVGRGSQADLRLELDAGGEDGELVLAGAISRDGDAWRGRLESLRLAPTTGPRLALEDSVGFRVGTGVLQLDRACLRAIEAGGRLCVAADGRRIDVDGEALPLSLLQPWLPVDEAVPMDVFGLIAIDARLSQDRAGGWQGEGTLTSAEGGLRLADEADHDVFGYRDLRLELASAGATLEVDLRAGLSEGGSLSATLRGGAATAPISGQVQLDVRDLTWLELFSEDIAAPAGRLGGTLTIAGTRAQPALSGTAELEGFAAELPGLGLKLRDGAFDLVGAADGSVRLRGQVASGDGVLNLDGSLDFRDDQAPLVLALRGDDVTIASTAELFLIADPDLTLRWLPDRLEVRGSLAVSEARVDLESLDSSVEVSADVVVVDPVEAPGARAQPLDLDFAVRLGDDVKLEGFGLDGRMTGAVTLRQRPGRRATATGTLEVDGTYRAYGQSLTIERARLAFADSPFDDPTLDIRADRRFDRAVVGVQVRGTARRPQTTVVSAPAMETSEALSYLVFGRPLNTTTGGESEQLGAAAVALGAGGNLVAQQLGARLGLDEAGVVDSRNLGGATFTIGKYVSPRLFLSYGVSLIGTGQVVTLKYLLTRGFDISIESGNENAASVNWRTER